MDHAITVRGGKNPLSNLHMCPKGCEFQVGMQVFNSSEQMYQHKRLSFHDKYEEASKILSMDNAFEVMKYSYEVLPSEKVQEEWLDMAVAQMEQVNHVKYHNCEHAKMLLEEAPGYLIQATSDIFWGSGLGPDMTKIMLQDYWPSQNNMGQVLTRI